MKLHAIALLLVLLPPTQAAGPADPTHKTETGIRYLTEPGTEKCELDFYYPVGKKGFPTIVYFHGGGLSGGKRSIPPQLQDRGWGVVGVSYRLSPEVKHPVYIEDAAAALAWTFKNVEAYGGDPSKIYVLGISAGGYLASMVGLDKSYLAKHDIDADRIAGIIPVSGQMITHQTIRKEQGIEPSQHRPTIDQYAPLYHMRKEAPPMCCITGGWGQDMLMRSEENLYFVSMMKLIGHGDVSHVVMEDANHSKVCKEAWPLVIDFVEKQLNKPASSAPSP